MSDLTEEIKQRVKSRAGHDQCVEEIERLQRALAESEKEQSSGKNEAPSDDVETTQQNFPPGVALIARMHARELIRNGARYFRITDNVSCDDAQMCLENYFLRACEDTVKLVLSLADGGSPATSVPALPPPVPSESEKDTGRLDWLRSGRGNWHWSVRCVKRDAETGEITVLNGDRLNAEIDSAMSSASSKEKE